MTWEIHRTREAHHINNFTTLGGSNVISNSLVSSKTNTHGVNESDLDYQSVDESVNWGQAYNSLCYHNNSEHAFLSDQLLCNVNTSSCQMRTKDQVNVSGNKKPTSNTNFNCQYSHANVINNYRRIQPDAASGLSILSSGNTSNQVPCNSTNTGDGFLHTNYANPYYYDQVVNRPNGARCSSKQSPCINNSHGGSNISQCQTLVPHMVDLLCYINDSIPYSINHVIFVHGSPMDSISGFYYNYTDYLGRLIPCLDPINGPIHTLGRGQIYCVLTRRCYTLVVIF